MPSKQRRLDDPTPEREAFFRKAKAFIKIWQSSDSIEEVIGRLRKHSVKKANVMALKLKRNGVELKKFPRTKVGQHGGVIRLPPKLWNRLAKYAKSVEAKVRITKTVKAGQDN
jgi:hypothetical protein